MTSTALLSSSLARVFFQSQPGWSSGLDQLYPVSESVCVPCTGAVCASDSGRLPFALTAELSADGSRETLAGPPCEFGGESSGAVARFWMDAFMGVAGLLGSASSGNISSSSADECMVESPSRSEGGVSSCRLRLRSAMVGSGRGEVRVAYQTCLRRKGVWRCVVCATLKDVCCEQARAGSECMMYTELHPC
jgi:hypothetical protein